MVLFELASETLPYENVVDLALVVPLILSGERPKLNENVPNPFAEIIRDGWKQGNVCVESLQKTKCLTINAEKTKPTRCRGARHVDSASVAFGSVGARRCKADTAAKLRRCRRSSAGRRALAHSSSDRNLFCWLLERL
jgi:hypothetical protein